MNSLEVFKAFWGEDLSQDSLDKMFKAPPDQIAWFGHKLADAWDKWLVPRLDEEGPGDNGDMMFLQPGFHHGIRSPISEATCKRLALYFNRILIADPLEAIVFPQMAVWSHTNLIDIERYRHDLCEGYLALLKIAPLVRADAIAIAPMANGSLRPQVQELARRELEQHNRLNQLGLADEEAAVEFVLATTLSAKIKHTPIAGTEQLFAALQRAATTLNAARGPTDRMGQAIATFDLPSAANVRMDDLLRLREQEEAFADFRDVFGAAVNEAAKIAGQDDQSAANAELRGRLREASDRCVRAAKGIPALEGFIMPSGAILTVGCALYTLGKDWDFLRLALDAAAPGAIWLAVRLLEAFSREHKAGSAAAAVYGALLERTD